MGFIRHFAEKRIILRSEKNPEIPPFSRRDHPPPFIKGRLVETFCLFRTKKDMLI